MNVAWLTTRVELAFGARLIGGVIKFHWIFISHEDWSTLPFLLV